MMRAATLVAPGRISIDTVPRPQPATGEVRIRLEGCGVCASNLGPWQGLPWQTYPTEPGALGHEAWGVVDAIGPQVDELHPGVRVAALSFKSFAEYDLARPTDLIMIPKSLEAKPVLGEPLGCAINIFRRCAIAPGQTVAIIGIGFLGAILTALASRAGARVLAISRRRSSLDLARRFGAADLIAMDDHTRIIEAVRAATKGTLCERVIEAVGKQWPLDLAGELVREGGKIIIAGYHQDGPRQVNMQAWNWKGIDVVNAHERDHRVIRKGVEEAIELVANGAIDTGPLYTHRFSLDELAKALDTTRDKPDGFVKAYITYA